MGDMGNNAGKDRAEARRFAAFISYSHADDADAAKLQRKLERYRLPKRIAQARASNNAALGPIFRDREDLAAAASLSAAIRGAIGRAEALVVMCSPDAATSPWVAAEIELFRELHPEKPILAVLLSGEPSTSFPIALTVGGNEPLAADLRPEGDGEQLGFLKIVAGIAGVPLDTLIQRDAQRRLRRVTVITAGALAAMLIMGIMTTLALQARNEAARQRAAAEGLVEYMLTDLGDKLDGVGRLDVMDGVNARALRYYDDQQSETALSPDSLNRRARILHAVGEIETKRGNFKNALARFQASYAITDALVNDGPANAEHLFAHAQSEYWLGRVAIYKDDFKGARKYWGAYLQHANRLAAVEPRKARSFAEVGYAHANLCEVEFDETGDPAKAEHDCTLALALISKAAKTDRGDKKLQIALANRQGWMADLFEVQGKTEQAIDQRLAEAATTEALIDSDPLNVEYLERSNLPAVGLVSLYIDRKDYRAASATLRQALARMDATLKRADDNPGIWIERLRLGYYQTELAKLQGGQWRDFAEAALRMARRAEVKFGPEIRKRTTAFDAIERQAASLSKGGQ